jgi:hypothetical protein
MTPPMRQRRVGQLYTLGRKERSNDHLTFPIPPKRPSPSNGHQILGVLWSVAFLVAPTMVIVVDRRLLHSPLDH